MISMVLQDKKSLYVLLSSTAVSFCVVTCRHIPNVTFCNMPIFLLKRGGGECYIASVCREGLPHHGRVCHSLREERDDQIHVAKSVQYILYI